MKLLSVCCACENILSKNPVYGAALTLGHSRRAYGGPGPFRMPDLQLAQITSVLGGDCRITSVLGGDCRITSVLGGDL